MECLFYHTQRHPKVSLGIKIKTMRVMSMEMKLTAIFNALPNELKGFEVNAVKVRHQFKHAFVSRYRILS